VTISHPTQARREEIARHADHLLFHVTDNLLTIDITS